MRVWCSGGMNEGSPFIVVLLLPGQVGRAAPQLGEHRGERGQDLAGGLPGGHPLGVGRELRQRGGPAVRQPPGGQPVQQRRPAPGWRRPRRRTAPPIPRVPAWPGRRPSRAWATASSSAGKVTSGSKPRMRLVAATSSAPSAEPCASPVFCLVGRGPGDDRPQRDERRLAGVRPGRPAARRAAARRPRGSPPACRQLDPLHVPAVGLVPRARRPPTWRSRCRPRSRSCCRRRPRSGCRAAGGAASDEASWLMPSSMSPSEAKTYTWWSKGLVPAAASGSSRPRSRRAAIAMPTALATPWPSGPVVVSTPGVCPCSGWPGVRLPQVR